MMIVKKSYPRKYWTDLSVVDKRVVGGGAYMTVVLGANDPMELDSEEAMNLAKKTAKKQGFHKVNGYGDIKVNGQNELALRKFHYRKYQPEGQT